MTDNPSTRNDMTLIAFMQASNCSNYAASWRHIDTTPDFLSIEYYQRIAKTLELGKFQLAFFDDRLAMPDRYQDDYSETVRQGIRAVKMDLIPLLTGMGLATEHLGLGATYSTSYYEPFHVARVFSTLDHVSRGRAAWNVVTSLNDSEAANFGQDQHLEHDLRYDRADEFMEVVLGHWDSWGEDAIRFDREQQLFADPAQVRRIEHVGRWFKSRGPFTVPRTPQGRPVLIQAGQSGRGQRFAAKWGDLVFVIFPNFELGQEIYSNIKTAVSDVGRNPDQVKIAPAIYCVVGETETIAREKHEYAVSLASPMDTLVLLSEVMNFDFAENDMDQPYSDAQLASMGGLQAARDRVIRQSGKDNPSKRDFIDYSGRGTLNEVPTFVGTPTQVADQLEHWYRNGACDGFVIAATHMPGAYEDFVRLVVPELQRRGIFQTEYRGNTLRENLGLPMPSIDDWHERK